MVGISFKKYKLLIFVAIFSFYLGCGITLNLVWIDCPDEEYTMNKEENKYSEVQYVVLILTSPDNVSRRLTIRKTWANFATDTFQNITHVLYEPSSIKIYFAVGTDRLDKTKLDKVQTENKLYKDIILLTNVKDTYKNLTLKLLESLNVLNDKFLNLKYVIKCDDDSFVRLDIIVKTLQLYGPYMNGTEIKEYVSSKSNTKFIGLYWGYFNGRARVYLNGKWQEKDWFLCDRYLPYALGGGYVISRDIVKYIARNVEYLSLYHSEDVSMGVWTAALRDINRVHDVRFDTEWTSKGCKNNMLIRHKQTESDMYEMYDVIIKSNGHNLCKKETIKMLRESYMYKWDALPSACCTT